MRKNMMAKIGAVLFLIVVVAWADFLILKQEKIKNLFLEKAYEAESITNSLKMEWFSAISVLINVCLHPAKLELAEHVKT